MMASGMPFYINSGVIDKTNGFLGVKSSSGQNEW